MRAGYTATAAAAAVAAAVGYLGWRRLKRPTQRPSKVLVASKAVQKVQAARVAPLAQPLPRQWTCARDP